MRREEKSKNFLAESQDGDAQSGSRSVQRSVWKHRRIRDLNNYCARAEREFLIEDVRIQATKRTREQT